jgi:hypothetical protein
MMTKRRFNSFWIRFASSLLEEDENFKKEFFLKRIN